MISDNSLNILSIANVNNANYNTTSEAVDKELKNEEKQSSSTASKDTNKAKNKTKEKKVKKASKTGQQKKGFFNNKLFCGDKSLNLRIPQLKLNFDRILNWGISANVCGKQKKFQPYAAVMSTANIIQNNPGLLSGDKESALNALLKSNLLEKMIPLGLGRAVAPCLLNRTSGSLYGSDNGMGPTLKSKNALREALYQDSCGAAIANVPLVSQFIDNNVYANLVSVMIGSANGQAGVYDWMNAALGIAGERQGAIGSLLGSLAYAYDYNVRDRIKVSYQLFNEGKITGADYMYFNTNSDLILSKLDEEKEKNNPNTTTPSQDFDMVIDVITKADSSWNEDDNYYKTKGNQTLNELANAKLINQKQKRVELTANYTTTVTAAHSISIINKFNNTTSSNNINKARVSGFNSSNIRKSSGCSSCA